MIDVQSVLGDLPHFDTFCSVEKLQQLVGSLCGDSRFEASVVGTSVGGVPIHHVRFGTGSLKALWVGGPHAMEPIGSLTVFSLMSLLQQGNRALLDADVEWHIVPCIDPDGAMLNEGWSLKPFTFENYIKNYYLQSTKDQVDCSFPVIHKDLIWTTPSHEAAILKDLIDDVLPDFYYGLHNAWIGGTYWFISRRLDPKYWGELHELTNKYGVPVQKLGVWKEIGEKYYEAVNEMVDVTMAYDYAALTSPHPEEVIRYGAGSRYYLKTIKPGAVTFVTEMGYVRHPSDESERPTGKNLRKVQLQLDANSKFLATVFLEEWERVKDQVDSASPFYRAIAGGDVIPLTEEHIAAGGMPMSWWPTRQILFGNDNNRLATEADLFNAAMINGGSFFLRWSSQFVRLLRNSDRTPAVVTALERVERAFEEAFNEIAREVDFSKFEAIGCDNLAKIQLGSGLIVMNSLLDTQERKAL